MHVPKNFYATKDMYDYTFKDICASLRNPIASLPRRVLTSFAIALSFTILWLLLSYDHLPSFLVVGPASTASTHWHGWANVDNLFVFGDSYTATDFDPKKEQPSHSNPFGNPSLPKPSSVDRKWIHYLAMTYNRTAIQTYNMASFGATMDGFVRYYHELYMPHYGISNHTKATGWNSTNTLFATFYGINDVRRCTDQPLTRNDCSEVYETLFTIYRFLLEQLYITGARNFLVLNIPPLDRMPFSRKWGHPVPYLAVSDWNSRLLSLANNLTLAHPDVTFFHFDTHALFNEVMDDPKSYPETALYKNTTNDCGEYKNLGKKDDFNEKCGIRLEKYLWHDPLHPTTAVHDAIAVQIAQMLEAGSHIRADEGQGRSTDRKSQSI